MFGRKKEDPQSQASAEPTQPVDPTAGDGRKSGPTPKRSAQQSQRQRPLVPTDRKLAKEQERKRRMEAQERLRLANETGDERYLLPRDQGPQKRYARNFVDSRWMFSEFMMFLIFGFLIASLIFGNNLVVQVNIQFALWIVLAIVILELIVTTIMLKKRLIAKYGSLDRGVRMYAAMRAMQFRKLRLPKPQVKRGESFDS
ncbi:DUF3043 domain-containing protein [Glutamicibacter sp. PS]|uniref:DUF3043 domain-containing protein n=1 Tax=Glutamicibacter sp. PS TaxID=3075634 RepID=UPI00284D355C|nr:DUF3043 domain-containing protein [Glutamicibacter sp. PS]MDR4532789.1 DUF3043 domain-containing protein [Glutamicibacter sp. PS]